MFLVWSILPVGILLLGVLVLASGRGEPDPTQRRGYAVYLAVTNFVTLFAILFASFAIVVPIADYLFTDAEDTEQFDEVGMPFGDPEFSDFEVVGPPIEEIDVDGGSDAVDALNEARKNKAIRDVVQAALVALPAVVLYMMHRRRRQELLGLSDFEGSAPWRVDRAYLYATCFSAVVILIIAAAQGGYSAFRAVAPGVTGDELGIGDVEQEEGLAGLVSFFYLFAGAVFIFVWHARQVRSDRPGWIQTTPEGPGEAPTESSDSPVLPAAAGQPSEAGVTPSEVGEGE